MEKLDLLIRGLSIDWSEIDPDSYLYTIPAIKSLSALDFSSPVTFFSGENGSGKSTLLEAMAVAYGFNPEGGTKNYSFSTYDSHSDLYRALRLSKGVIKARWGYYLRAESFYNVASMETEYAKGGGRPRQYHLKSHGESFLSVMQDNFSPQSIYFLDEPEAALSPQRQLTLICEIDRCVKAGSQFIITTHSPILLAMPQAQILNFDDQIQPCAYEDTESYQITKMFIEDRDQILYKLLGSV